MAIKKMLIITPQDNVGVVLEDVHPGDICTFEGTSIPVQEEIPFPHKLALVDLPPETLVVKYGEAIGHATVPIRAGCLVHTHNMGCRRGTNDREGKV